MCEDDNTRASDSGLGFLKRKRVGNTMTSGRLCPVMPAPRSYHSAPVRPPRTLLWNVPPTAHMACSHYPIRWTTFLLKNILKYIQLKFHFTFRVQHSSLPQPVTDLPPRTEQHSIECMSHSVYSISFDGPLGCFHLSFHYSLTRILVCKNGCLRPCFHYGASW